MGNLNRRLTISLASASLVLSGSIVGAGPVAGADQQVIDRAQVMRRVQATSPSNSALRKMSRLQKARALGRCFALSTETYCLGIGFVSAMPTYRRLARPEVVGSGGRTGDMPFGRWMARRAKLSNRARIAVEQREVREAIAGVAKARWVDATTAAARGARTSDPPPQFEPSNAIMYGKETRQERSNWCGPATLQSIHWGSPNGPTKVSQTSWASSTHLGTTAAGSAITDMVHEINLWTTWDDVSRGGDYIVEDVTPQDGPSFYAIHQAHLSGSSGAPIVEHPQLLNQYFSYLKYDHSGHFQVGRGYRTTSSGVRTILIFEVFNEADWNSSGNTTWGAREVSSANLLLATKAHPLHNFGL